MKISIFLVAFGSLLCVSAKSSAQTVDTVQLKVIAISEDRSMVFSKGNFISVIDSSSVASSPHQSIAELLSANSSSFIKTYSFGGSATISSKGTEARHNVVLWNGFNINSSSLGLSDLSLIPSFISDEITLLHGGSGPVNGNSALGSTIILGNTDPEFLKKNRIRVNIETRSFGKYLGSFMYKTENKYASSKTILFYNQAENNFEFVNFTHREKPVVKQKNASYKNYGILQNLDFKLNQKNILSLGLWYQVYDRELPPIMTSEHSYASQRDSNLRVTLGYKIILQGQY
ncbi:MAG: TonB-dependent receptor plug domain-containing protein [Bacteroidetes bacterium]|nr:TonB-dependent receptor plug domain-containing protein [Bacteroidota bacterium]